MSIEEQNENKFNLKGFITMLIVAVAFLSCCVFCGRASNPANYNSDSKTAHIVVMASAKMIGNKNVKSVKGYDNQAKIFFNDNKATIKNHPSCKKATFLIPLFTGLDKGTKSITNSALRF